MSNILENLKVLENIRRSITGGGKSQKDSTQEKLASTYFPTREEKPRKRSYRTPQTSRSDNPRSFRAWFAWSLAAASWFLLFIFLISSGRLAIDVKFTSDRAVSSGADLVEPVDIPTPSPQAKPAVPPVDVPPSKPISPISPSEAVTKPKSITRSKTAPRPTPSFVQYNISGDVAPYLRAQFYGSLTGSAGISDGIIRLVNSGDYAGVRLYFNRPVDISSGYVSFMVKGARGGEDFIFSVSDTVSTKDKSKVEVKPFYSGLPPIWQKIFISPDNLKYEVDTTKIAWLGFEVLPNSKREGRISEVFLKDIEVNKIK